MQSYTRQSHLSFIKQLDWDRLLRLSFSYSQYAERELGSLPFTGRFLKAPINVRWVEMHQWIRNTLSSYEPKFFKNWNWLHFFVSNSISNWNIGGRQTIFLCTAIKIVQSELSSWKDKFWGLYSIRHMYLDSYKIQIIKSTKISNFYQSVK